jgi:hypothetical protein
VGKVCSDTVHGAVEALNNPCEGSSTTFVGPPINTEAVGRSSKATESSFTWKVSALTTGWKAAMIALTASWVGQV